jgi:hypothetical protein
MQRMTLLTELSELVNQLRSEPENIDKIALQIGDILDYAEGGSGALRKWAEFLPGLIQNIRDNNDTSSAANALELQIMNAKEDMEHAVCLCLVTVRLSKSAADIHYELGIVKDTLRDHKETPLAKLVQNMMTAVMSKVEPTSQDEVLVELSKLDSIINAIATPKSYEPGSRPVYEDGLGYEPNTGEAPRPDIEDEEHIPTLPPEFIDDADVPRESGDDSEMLIISKRSGQIYAQDCTPMPLQPRPEAITVIPVSRMQDPV